MKGGVQCNSRTLQVTTTLPFLLKKQNKNTSTLDSIVSLQGPRLLFFLLFPPYLSFSFIFYFASSLRAKASLFALF